MKRSIVKFGGSNLKTPEDVQRLTQIVALYPEPPVVVVSAFYGVTNQLVDLVREAADSDRGPDSGDDFVRSLRESLDLILQRNGLTDSPGLQAIVDERLRGLERLLRGISYLGDVPPSVHDHILSFGERLSAPIIAAAFRAVGLEARESMPEHLGLFTDGQFGNAACDFEASTATVAQGLAGPGIHVIPGFYGVDQKGRPTLFGRGGSDYTAAALARLIGAESLDLWKDVDGFLSGEPALVKDHRVVPHLSYSEAAELSYFGAKILHPRTVEPLIEPRIPVRILDIRRPDDGVAARTVIDGRRSFHEGVVKCVTSTENIAIVKIHGPGVGFRPGILAKATTALHDHGINIKSVLTAQTSICLLVGQADAEEGLRVLKDHHLPGLIQLSAIQDLALVAVVGDGILDDHGYGVDTASEALGACARHGVRLAMAGMGASEVAVYLIVPKDQRGPAVQAIHGHFFPT